MNEGRSVWVFAGGEFSPEDIPSKEQSPGDFHLCVDRGVEYCLQAGLEPGLLIGDFDSVSPEILLDVRLEHVPRQVHPRGKAASDLELALEWLVKDPPDRVILLGVSGGRTDHMLFNWSLPLLREWPFNMQLIDSTTHAYLITKHDQLSICAELGQTISLLVLSVADGVSTTGLQYELNNATMLPGSTLGLSNVADATKCTVSLKSGAVLVMVQKLIQGP